MARTKLRNVKLNEVSFVGKGDNPEADIMILKMKPASIAKCDKQVVKENLLKKWMEDNPTLIMKEEGEALTFDEIQTDRALRDEVWNMVWMLEDSLGSIIRDDSVSDKTAMIQQTIDQFKTAVTELTKGDESMSVELKKKLDDEVKKSEALAKENETLKAEIETLKAKSGTEDDGTCKACGAKKVTKGEEEDIYKGLPEAVVKKMKEDSAKIAKMEDNELTREYIGKAATVSLVGSADEVGSILKDIAKHDVTLADKVHGVLKAANARIEEGDLLVEKGKTSTTETGVTKAYDKMVVKADELRKARPELTKEKAFSIVYDTEHELRTEYLKER